VLDECCLNCVWIFRSAQSFDRRDLFVRRVDRKHETRVHGLPVEQNSTRTTRTHVADELGTSYCRIEMIAQRVEKSSAWLDLRLALLSIHVENYFDVSGKRHRRCFFLFRFSFDP